MWKLVLRWAVCLCVLQAACEGAAPPELPSGARVQFPSPRPAGQWTAAIVGKVGECTALMVPDDWTAPNRFRVVRIDSVRELRISTRYDGLPGDDGRRRTVKLPPDTVGEGWTSLPLRALRARYGACDN
jgi:hypothetical protein